jgi:hypothetical protein
MGKSKDVNTTLSQARRNAPYTALDYVLYLSVADYGLVERTMLRKFRSKRVPDFHEVVNAPLLRIR